MEPGGGADRRDGSGEALPPPRGRERAAIGTGRDRGERPDSPPRSTTVAGAELGSARGSSVFGERERRREQQLERERERERERDRERSLLRRVDQPVMPARPLLRPAPRSAMIFPLVVLVAVLPGLYALNSWDLTPPGPWWGLRGLAVLDGFVFDQTPAAATVTPALEAQAFRAVASQPPLYAWLEAVGLALSSDRNPLATVLPSYVAGAMVVVLVYLHGRLWGGSGLGLVAAVLTGFNRHLLVQMQQATPTTLALVGVLGVLYCYAAHWKGTLGSSTVGAWPWELGWDWFRSGSPGWGVLGGLALGISLMSVGLFGLLVIPVVLLHQAYLASAATDTLATTAEWSVSASTPARVGNGRGKGASRWRRGVVTMLTGPSMQAGLITLAVALLVAGPWYASMFQSRGFDGLAALLTPFDTGANTRPSLLGWMIRLAPATLPLGIYGAVRAAKRALADDDTDDPVTIGGAFWFLWLAAAAVAPAFWPSAPRYLGGLFLLVPLNLLSAQAIVDLASRKIPVRALTWLAPATAAAVVWWSSDSLRVALDHLVRGDGHLDATTALGLHLALDLLIAAVWLTRRLDRWARRRDDRQRMVLAGYLLAVLAITIVTGSREIWFRHRETDELLMLRTMILRHHRERPFTQVDVIGPELFHQPGDADGPVPGGRLRFILRSALPHLPQRDLARTDELLATADLELPPATSPPSSPSAPSSDATDEAQRVQRLVILAGRDQSLPYPVQSRLELEAIYPGRRGLDAFATAHNAPTPRK